MKDSWKATLIDRSSRHAIMHNDDPYRVLGIDRTASKEEIKRAFRKKALEYHPDIHQSSPEAVQRNAAAQYEKVARAYEQLSNPTRASGYQPRGGAAPSWQPRSGYQHTSYYKNRHNATPGFFSTFKNSGSLLITVALGCVCVGGLYALDPWIQNMWIERNRGKLFADMVDELHERREKRSKPQNQHAIDVSSRAGSRYGNVHSLSKDDLIACFQKTAVPRKHDQSF